MIIYFLGSSFKYDLSLLRELIKQGGYKGGFVSPLVVYKFFGSKKMAYYEHLPIYKKAMETAVYFETIVRNFSRYNKYNLGAEMRTKSRECTVLLRTDIN